MNSELWKRIEQIFDAAAEIPEMERAAYLEQACNGDGELRREVESLLAADGGYGHAIQATIQSQAAELAVSGEELVGKRIGVWRLARVVGRGGMGTVYLAVRDDDAFRKQAALKLIRRGMDTALVVSSFRRERQILAQLDHPYIARLLDGGATDDGLPYFVMEYVEGKPITDYCAENKLSVPERVRLFREVCAAVQYAHQNLVVHRDLKPGNIFVTKDGTPKLLDFGLAKLVDPETGAQQTATGLRMLTPDYASPEQVRGEPVTTASDIYSLGVVLYELLAGRRPYDVKTESWSDVEEKICRQEPRAPSTAVPALRGDLDNIVLMALRKEPGRRYATAQQFAEDIRRYEVGLPVVARKDTLFYRTGKFVRRNRWRVAAAALVAVSLLTGTVVALQQARRAERQSEAARTMAMTMLIDVNEKFRVLPGSVDGRRLLVEKGLEGLDLISKEARGDPVVMWDLARGYERIASLQASPDPAEPTLWDRTKGLELYRRALAIAETLRQKGRNDQDMLLLLNYIHLGIGGNTPDLPEATRHLQQSLELNAMLKPELGRRWEPDGPPLVSYLRDEAYFILSNKTRPTDPQAALEYSRKVSHAQMRGWGIMTALHRMGDLQGAANQALSVERHTAQEIEHRGFPNDLLSQVQAATRALSAIVASNSLGNPFGPNLDDPLSAADACKRAVAGLEDALKRDPTDPNLRARRFLGLACLGAALSNTNPQASVAAYREALSREEHLPPPRISAFGAYFEPRWQISYPLRKLGMRSEALQQARQALERRLSVAAHLAVGDAELDLGNRPAALEHYRLALAMAEKQVAAVPRDMVLRDQLGRAYQRLGNYHETANDLRAARDWYEKALDVWRGWTKYGISSPYNVRREREAARMIARCEARLARK